MIIAVEKKVDFNKNPKVRKFIINKIMKKGTFESNDLKLIAGVLKCRRVEFAGDLKGAWLLIGTYAQFEKFSPDNPTTAEGMIKLQVKDVITGECDRHPGNYFIDDQGNVTGIDEDCCFGVDAIPEGVDVRDQGPLMGFIPNNASLMLRMPNVITQSIKDRIDELYANSEELVSSLLPYISSDEMAATLTRLEKLHSHVNDSSTCLVVSSKDELLSEEARLRADTNNSYWARELLVFSNDEEGWNYLRAHRTL